MDVDAIIAGAATDSSKKKSTVPTKVVNDPEIVKGILDYKGAKKDKAIAEARLKMISEDVLVPFARHFHTEQVTDKVPTTVKLQTEDGDAVDVDVAKNQYSKISVKEEPTLKELFGSRYEDFFSKKLDIKLTSAAISDKDILAKLIKAVGQDNFAKYFKVEHTLVPTEAFHNARFTDKKAAKPIAKVIGEGVVKPYSPAIRG